MPFSEAIERSATILFWLLVHRPSYERYYSNELFIYVCLCLSIMSEVDRV